MSKRTKKYIILVNVVMLLILMLAGMIMVVQRDTKAEKVSSEKESVQTETKEDVSKKAEEVKVVTSSEPKVKPVKEFASNGAKERTADTIQVAAVENKKDTKKELVQDTRKTSKSDVKKNNVKQNNAKQKDVKQKARSKYTIVIDAGHQAKGNSALEPIGPGASEKKAKVASGTSGKYSGLAEYELNLQVALKLEKRLKKLGYKVIMVRKTNNVNLSNAERAKVANGAKADAFIRIHADGSENASATGNMTICPTKNNPYCKQIYSKSRRLSEVIAKGVTKATGGKSRGVWETDTMSGINWCQVPVTILEMGFMSNRKEDLKMAQSDYQMRMVEGIVNGFEQYFKIS